MWFWISLKNVKSAKIFLNILSYRYLVECLGFYQWPAELLEFTVILKLLIPEHFTDFVDGQLAQRMKFSEEKPQWGPSSSHLPMLKRKLATKIPVAAFLQRDRKRGGETASKNWEREFQIDREKTSFSTMIFKRWSGFPRDRSWRFKTQMNKLWAAWPEFSVDPLRGGSCPRWSPEVHYCLIESQIWFAANPGTECDNFLTGSMQHCLRV